ncbi:biorientation of chromosomes in cell division protein 1-like 1 isoform X2 [Etheostoma cragini]|uniref:biorientation of chromosomes in cell division protein 1-like 1 isoform X2 n=1 Tax=Etheostoma cragini TaxID=417921 RepID=UPI00155F35C6|nr:biorientation of chromosomes in cell division protein 1-like 1 isoform X2 [Etheostoma cragini]
MAGLPPGDPQLVSMIVNHLKTQGLFDQFRRDCLADVDTKPAYLNLKQRVDNFVSNHLSNHTWSPHLNKNQLRNNIRQLVLQSGMLEQGVDRIVAQVVDPKINHIFRPQVERVVREFLSPGSYSEEPPAPLPSTETKADSSIPEQASSSAPATTAASDAMSILDTITSLNQEASVRASSDKGRRGPDEPTQLVEDGEPDLTVDEEGDSHQDGRTLTEAEELASDVQALEVKTEDTQEQIDLGKEGLIEEVKKEEEESGAQEPTVEERDKVASRTTGKPTEEKQDDDLLKSTSHAKQKARERMKEEYFLEDSDLEGLSDITVSSVHTSDLSSFEEQSDEDEMQSDSSEEGELPSDDERAEKKQASGDAEEEEEERKPRRKAYVHKPFLYSRYYSDSDDEITVEERRRSVAKDKEERLLKRQQNRERMEEKRKQKTAEEDHKKLKSADSSGLDGPRAKEARKERKVLEKKMALNRKRKLDSRKEGDVSSKKRDTEVSKKTEGKFTASKPPQPKLVRNLSESTSSDERKRRMSGSVVLSSEDSSETKKLSDKGRTHSFILELEQGSQEALKQRSVGKFDRFSRKEFHSKERKEKECSLSDERAKLKQKQERKSEHQADESQQKEGAAVKVSSEEKAERKPKTKSEKKMSGTTREGKSLEGLADEGPKDATVKKAKAPSVETVKAEKDKNREKEKDKDKIKEKEKAKGERTSAKSDFKQLLCPDSAGSSEDRSDMEPGYDSSKKKEKHSKEVLKRSKSHTEDRPGDKLKSKTDSKDNEKEKTKADQDSQKSNKSSSEMDKDPKRVKPTEKGRIMEKSKSKEETKSLLLSKTDNRIQSLEVKSTGGVATSKLETTKEKKKEGNAKEQRKVSEEPPHEKAESKSAKKKAEKKDKVSEKKDDGQEEKKAPREDKLEKSDKSSKSSVSSLDAEEQPKKQSLLQDTSTDSDPVTTTIPTSFSDDTCDALSDITPEPPEGETESRLSEMTALPAEADALLALMDVCTSAEARLLAESGQEDATPEMTLQDADMKMKEAALTLLSMDPDSTVSCTLICHDTREEPEVTQTAPQLMEITALEQEESPMDVKTAAEAAFIASEPSSEQTVDVDDEKPNPADGSENSEKEMDVTRAKMSESPTQEDDTRPTSNKCQALLNDDEAKSAEIVPETQPDENTAPPPPADEEAASVVSEAQEVGASTDQSTIACDTTEQVSEIPTKQEQAEPDVADTKTIPKGEGVVAEDNQAKMDTDIGEAESKTVEEENVTTKKSDPQTIEHNVPQKTEESGPESQSKLVKQISNVSSADSQEDEKGSDLSEKEEKAEGRRGRRKRRLSTQSVAAVKESGDEREEKESKEQKSAEETDQEKVGEVRTPRRGRSSKTTDEAEKDQPKEPEKLEETLSRGEICSGGVVKEANADNQKKDENKDEGSTDKTTKPAKREETIEEESGPRNIAQQGSQVNLPSPVLENTEAAGSSDSKPTTDTRKPAMKRKRSEEIEESEEEAQAKEEGKKDNSQEEQREQQPDRSCSPTVSRTESGEEICSEKNPDDLEGEQEEDQETTPKRHGRRGQLSKSAEDPGKKMIKRQKKVSRMMKRMMMMMMMVMIMMVRKKREKKELQPEQPHGQQLAWRLKETSQVNPPPGQVGRAVKRRPQLAHAGRGARQQQRGAVNGRPAPLRCKSGEDRNQRSPLPREPNAKTAVE